jgi:autotransporter-associated beta strand protein
MNITLGALKKDNQNNWTIGVTNGCTITMASSTGVVYVTQGRTGSFSVNPTLILIGNTLEIKQTDGTANETGQLSVKAITGSGNIFVSSGQMSSTSTITLSSTVSTVGSITTTGKGKIIISGAITDAITTLTKGGTGTLTLSGAGNAYTGLTTVNLGTLVVAADGALGGVSNGTLVNSGGSLAFDGNTTYTSLEALTLTGSGWSNQGALANLSGSNTFGGAITTTGDFVVGGSAGRLTLTGAINADGSIVKVGNAAIVLASSNAISGSVSIMGGLLMSSTAGALGGGSIEVGPGAGLAIANADNIAGGQSVQVNGGFFGASANVSAASIASVLTGTSYGTFIVEAADYAQAINMSGVGTGSWSLGSMNAGIIMGGSLATIGGNYVLGGGGGVLTIAATNYFTGGSAVIVGSAGALTLVIAAPQDYTGGTMLKTGATMQVGSAGQVMATSGTFYLDGGVFDLNGVDQTIGALMGTGSVINSNGTTTRTITLNYDQNGSFEGSIAGTVRFIKDGAGTMTMNGSFANYSTIGVTNGTLIMGGANKLPTLASGNALLINGGVFDMNGYSQTVKGQLTGSGGVITNSSTTPVTLTLRNEGASSTFYGDITGTMSLLRTSSTYTLTLSGVLATWGDVSLSSSGALVLTNDANTFTGNVAITNAILRINSNGALGNAENDVTLGTYGVLRAGSSFELGAGHAITLADAQSRIDTNGYDVTTLGLLTGTGRLYKLGGGTLTLGGSSDYTGGTVVGGGTLAPDSDADLGAVPSPSTTNIWLYGGTLRLPSDFSASRSIYILTGSYGGLEITSGTMTLTNNVTGGGTLVKTGSGTLVLTASLATTGAVVAQQGLLVLSSTAAVGGALSTSSYGMLALDASAVSASAPIVRAASITMAGRGETLVIGSSSTDITQTIAGTASFSAGGLSKVTLITGTAFGNTFSLSGTQNSVSTAGVVLFRGTNLGSTPGAGVSTVRVADTSMLVGGGGPAGTSTISIAPRYAVGFAADAPSQSLATIEGGRLRAINVSTEFVDYASLTSSLENASITAGGEISGTNVNALRIANATGSAMTVTVGTATSLSAKAFWFDGADPISVDRVGGGVISFTGNTYVQFLVTNTSGVTITSPLSFGGTTNTSRLLKTGTGSLTLTSINAPKDQNKFEIHVLEGTLKAGAANLLGYGYDSFNDVLTVYAGAAFDMNGYSQTLANHNGFTILTGGFLTNSGANATLRTGQYDQAEGYIYGTVLDGTPEDGAATGLVSLQLNNQTQSIAVYRGGQTFNNVEAWSNGGGANYISLYTTSPSDHNVIYGQLIAPNKDSDLRLYSIVDPTISQAAMVGGTANMALSNNGELYVYFSGTGGTLTSSNTIAWSNTVSCATSGGRLIIGNGDGASSGAKLQLGRLSVSGAFVPVLNNDFQLEFVGNSIVGGSNASINVASLVTLNGSLTGTAPFTKTGVGQLVVTGTLAVGSLSVTNGTLSAQGPAIGGNVFVAAGAELALTHADGLLVGTGATLSGNGLISGTVNVQAGGIVAPGASIGTLTIQNLTLADALLNWELDAPGTGDLLICSTSLTASGVSTFQFTGSNWAMGYYTLINYGAFTGSIDNFAVAGTPGVPGTMWRLSETGSSIILQILSAENAWNKAAGGDWSNASNWTAEVPNSIGAPVILGSALAAPDTVNLDIAPTVGAIKFDNANKYTIGGTYTLTLATSSGNASIQVDTGSHEIAAPVTLGSDLAANIAGDLLTISGPIDGPYGVTKTGAGKLEINGTATYTGTTHVVNGELSLGAAQTLGAVVIDSSALVTLVDGATQISSLEIAGGSSAPEAKLDIMSSALIIDYSGGSSPLAEIEALIIKGYNGGDWAGNGITSSVLFDITAEAIGVIDNTTFLGGGLGEFAGRSIGMETVLVRKVIAGDIDMSGEVNAADYFYIDFNLDTAGGGWGAGDLDYSGETNSADYFYIDFNLGMSEGASMGTSIPEPATLVLLTLGGLAVVRRRR